MGSIARHIITLLVIIIFVSRVRSVRDYPLAAFCLSDDECLRGKAKCIRNECHCIHEYDIGNGGNDCKRWKKCSPVHEPIVCKRVDGADDNAHCISEDGFITNACKCNTGYFGLWQHDNLNYKCIYAGVDKNGKYPCMMDRNCPNYSMCVNNRCECKAEFRGNGETCKPTTINCNSHRDCLHEFGKCYGGVCRCIGMNAGNGQYCRRARRCRSKKDCGKLATCMRDPFIPADQCICNPGYFKNSKGDCVECTSTRNCNHDGWSGFLCVKDKCRCPKGKWQKHKTCVPRPECINNGECPVKYSVCKNEKCTTPECTSNAGCNYNENSAHCVKGTCRCKDELIKEGKKCKPAPIQICRANFDCHHRAKCRKGKCICQGWYVGNGKYCRASRPCPDVNKCGKHGTCLLDPLLLKSPQCRCEEGYEVHPETGVCFECFNNDDCNAVYSTCINGTCKCKDELIKEGKICKPAPLHQCENSLKDDCHKNSKCAFKRCYCQGQTVGNGRFCRDALPCPKDHKCGEHSTCVVDPLFPNTTECRCDQGYKKSVDGKCLVLNDCERKSMDCPAGAKCGKLPNGAFGCACDKGHKTVSKGEKLTCEDIDECTTGEARCSGDRCTNTVGSYTCVPCPYGFTDGADGTCVGTFKGSCNCNENEECRLGKCKCKKGYKRTKGGECVGGNVLGNVDDKKDVKVPVESGSPSQFASRQHVLLALGLLGSLAFTRC